MIFKVTHPSFRNPKRHINRLNQPKVLKTPSKIFVCSMADLFGDWVPVEWVESVLNTVKLCPQHIFQFLTKNPERYLEFKFPRNCWLGITVDYPNQKRIDVLNFKTDYKFISFEPILGNMSKLDLTGIDLCIIGRDTSPGAKFPKQEWIDSINHKNIFLKENLNTNT